MITFLPLLISSWLCFCVFTAVVTTTTATTIVQVPYPQQPGVAIYPAGGYQGYNPLPVQPHHGMPAAPYPTQYPPPYIAQPTGPPTYHETVAGKTLGSPRRGHLKPLIFSLCVV